MSGSNMLLARAAPTQGAPPPSAMTAGARPQPGAPPPAPNMLLAASPTAAPPPPANPMTAAVAQHLQSLPPDKLAQEAVRADYLVHALGTLARKPNVTIKDVISQAGQAVADKMATPKEAMQEVMHMPKDPAALQAAVQQRFKAAIIAASMLSGVKPGAQGAEPDPGSAMPQAKPLMQGLVGSGEGAP